MQNKAAANSGLAKVAVQYFVKAFVQG